jgi:hypothetical protein
MVKLHRRYFIFSAIIFLVEVFIAIFIHDAIIRPYIGDFLMVILIYCFIKSFFDFRVLPTAVFVLLFSYAIESLQYLKVVEKFGIKNMIVRIIMGTSFEWSDILAYTLGVITILIIENKTAKYNLREAMPY